MVYIDQNAARSPNSPLEPLFRSVFALKPEFDIGKIDLVTDRNNIRKLLRFINETSKDSFQIQVEIINGKTAMFTRMQGKTTEVIVGFRGYGHNFEKAYTKSATGSTGHHRIVSYDFGGLKCVVRHETDGYMAEMAPATIKKPAETSVSLSNLLETLKLSESVEDPKPTSHITVKSEGEEVDISSILEIKTRAAGKTLDMTEVTPQLWISQTPHLVVGYHQGGVFRDVQVRDMTEAINNWEKRNRQTLRRLGGLLKRIIAVVKESAGNVAVVRYDGGPQLRIITCKQKIALPEALYAKLEGKEQDIDAKETTGQKEVRLSS